MKKLENLTNEEFEDLEREYNRRKQEEEQEQNRLMEEQKREGLRLFLEGQENDYVRNSRETLRFIEDQAGDLVHDPDFLWQMICVAFYNAKPRIAFEAQSNHILKNIVAAYKRERDRKS